MILAADVGGTKTLLALAERRAARVHLLFKQRYENDCFGDFAGLLAAFLRDASAARGGTPRIPLAIMGVAGPVADNRVRLTNRAWEIDGAALAVRFDIDEVFLLNDFVAAAHGVSLLEAEDLLPLQAGKRIRGEPQVLLGAGTGFGVALRLWVDGAYRVCATEAGNTGFAPATPAQAELWRYIHAQTGRVGIEQVVSGPGLATIYRFLRDGAAAPESTELARRLRTDDPAASIIAHALDGRDRLAARALDLFVEAYGAAAGDQALALVARGGVYIAGGIAPRIAKILQQGRFLESFRAKGRFAALMAEMPVSIVLNPDLGMLGAAAHGLQWS